MKLLKMSINMLDIRGNYVNISNKMRRELKEDKTYFFLTNKVCQTILI